MGYREALDWDLDARRVVEWLIQKWGQYVDA